MHHGEVLTPTVDAHRTREQPGENGATDTSTPARSQRVVSVVVFPSRYVRPALRLRASLLARMPWVN